MSKGFLRSFLDYLFNYPNPERRIEDRGIRGTVRRFIKKLLGYQQLRTENQNILDYVDPKSSKYLDKVIKYGIRLPYGWDRDYVVEAERFMNEGFLGYLLDPRYNIKPKLSECLRCRPSPEYLDKVIEYGIRPPWDDEGIEVENPIVCEIVDAPESVLGAIKRFVEKIMRYPSLKRYYKNILNYIDR